MRHSISRVNFREDDEILLPSLVTSCGLDDFRKKVANRFARLSAVERC